MTDEPSLSGRYEPGPVPTFRELAEGGNRAALIIAALAEAVVALEKSLNAPEDPGDDDEARHDQHPEHG